MDMWKAVLLYLRSNTNLFLSALFVLAFVLSLAFGSWAAAIVVAVAYPLLAGAILFSRRGAKEIVHERDEENTRYALEKIDEADAVRRKLTYLRIPDEQVAKELGKLLLVSGRLLEAARREGRYIPAAGAMLEEALSACSAYLKGLDAAAVERRFDVPAGSGERQVAASTGEFLSRAALRMEELRRSELPDGSSDLDILTELDDI